MPSAGPCGAVPVRVQVLGASQRPDMAGTPDSTVALMPTSDDYARAVITEGQRRGITPRGIVIALATVIVESGNPIKMWANSKVPASLNLPHDAVGSDGYSVGLFQQQVVQGNGGQWWWGDAATCMDPTKSAGLFYDRLSKLDYNGPNSPGSYAQAIQRSAYPTRYDQRMGDAQRLYDRLTNGQENPVGFTGDPVWLEDVLREALGDRLVAEPGWADRGTGGTMGDIWGTMIHHTGNVNETVALIRDGRSDLAGPLSQGLITPDGIFHLIAVGPCNHAGIGNYADIGQNQGNQRLIGFECAYNGSGPWPQKQIITMRDATAAISKKLGKKAANSVVGHKEYANKPPNVKVDPGNMDMNWFRGEVQKDLDGFVFPGEQLTTVPPTAPVKQWPKDYSDRELLEWIVAQLGDGDPAWPSKGMTLRDKVWSLDKDAS